MSDDATTQPLWGPGSGGLAVPSSTATVIQRQWMAIGAPGTWWTGRERVAVAAAARAADRADPRADGSGLPRPVTRAAALISATPHSVDAVLVDGLESAGVDRLAYTEIVGVVARVVAIDTAARGVGAELRDLPAPRSGEPSRETVPQARRRSSFVPMVGGAGPATALSAVPRECRDQEELHGELYLSYADMVELEIVKGLTRPQMEAVAARTSLVNQCHF